MAGYRLSTPPRIGCHAEIPLQVVLTRPRPAADIQESRAGAKSPTLNVDAPTQGAVYLTSLCEMLTFLFHPHNGECHCITQHVFSPSGPGIGIGQNENRHGDRASQGASADQALRSIRCRSSDRLVWVLRSASVAIAGSTVALLNLFGRINPLCSRRLSS